MMSVSTSHAMHPVFQKNAFLVKEHVGALKASNAYDLFDPATGEKLLECREPNLSGLTKLFRFTDSKRSTPFDVHMTTPSGERVLEVKRGIALFLSKVEVLDGRGSVLGRFEQKLFSIGGKFDVLDPAGAALCTLQGKFTAWEFRFFSPTKDYAVVSKKWAGVGKELFTSADDYVVQIKDSVAPGDPVRPLILAAVIVVDMVLKE